MAKRHWGRPPPQRVKATATLTHPKAVMFSAEDMAMIEALKASSGHVSIGQVVRCAVRGDYKRLLRRQSAKKARVKN